MISSSKVIKLPRTVTRLNNVSEKVFAYLQDEDLKKVIDEKVKRAEKKSFKDGHSTGVEEGRNEGKQKFDASITQLQTCVEEMNAYIASLHKELEQESIKLVFALSEKIVRRELSASTEISRIISESLRKLPEKRCIILKVNPLSQECVGSIISQLQVHNIPADQVTVEVDQSIEQGGCYIETDNSVVDGRVDKIISEVENRLQELAQWEPNN